MARENSMRNEILKSLITGLFCFGLLTNAFLINAIISNRSAMASAAESVFSISDKRIEQLTQKRPVSFYVSLKGNDQWSGRRSDPNAAGTDGPFRTLEKARDALRQARNDPRFDLKKSVVIVRGGLYELDKPFELARQDGGGNDYPVVWKAADGEKVQLSGGRYLNKIEPVRDLSVLNCFAPEVRSKIFQIDLKASGIGEYGSPNGGGVEPFFNDKPMFVSRYPNEGFMKISEVDSAGSVKNIRGTIGIKEGWFFVKDKRVLQWKKEKDAWVHGYWFWDWAEQRHKIESIDEKTLEIKTVPPYHTYGYRKNMMFYGFNLLSEIDKPGEYYIDREKGILYFYPPEKIKKNSFLLTVIPNIVLMQNVSNLIFSGFDLEASTGIALKASSCDGVLIAGCQFRNIGGEGVSLSGKNSTVFGCHFYQIGRGAVICSGGNRTTLAPGLNCVLNNDIHDYGRIQRIFACGVSTSGVGNRIAHNRISDAPHMGIYFGGNDYLFEYNEIYNVCYESNDAGAVYAGRNWTMRGNVIRYNYLHDLCGFEKKGCVGIYLDDMFSSADIYGNLFVNVTRAAFIGGGRDCSIINNIFVDCHPSIHVDTRALGWAHKQADDWIAEAEKKGTLAGINYNKPPYSVKYPKLVNILNENPAAPVGNLIEKNIVVGGSFNKTRQGQWQGDSIQKTALPFITIRDNLVEADPMFVDRNKGDYRLKPGSPAIKLGFQPIPFEKMGLYDHPAARHR